MSYFTAYMSQPKIQLETFKVSTRHPHERRHASFDALILPTSHLRRCLLPRCCCCVGLQAWAGLSSDISYYLNSHHVDFSEWVWGDKSRCVRGWPTAEHGPYSATTHAGMVQSAPHLLPPSPPLHCRPVRVVATAASGVAEKALGRPCEDTISLHATWQNVTSGSTASASYTASWIAPPTDVHTQQRFFAMSHGGEVTVDQAHRGYSVSTDGEACRNVISCVWLAYRRLYYATCVPVHVPVPLPAVLS